MIIGWLAQSEASACLAAAAAVFRLLMLRYLPAETPFDPPAANQVPALLLKNLLTFP